MHPKGSVTIKSYVVTVKLDLKTCRCTIFYIGPKPFCRNKCEPSFSILLKQPFETKNALFKLFRGSQFVNSGNFPPNPGMSTQNGYAANSTPSMNQPPIPSYQEQLPTQMARMNFGPPAGQQVRRILVAICPKYNILHNVYKMYMKSGYLYLHLHFIMLRMMVFSLRYLSLQLSVRNTLTQFFLYV